MPNGSSISSWFLHMFTVSIVSSMLECPPFLFIDFSLLFIQFVIHSPRPAQHMPYAASELPSPAGLVACPGLPARERTPTPSERSKMAVTTGGIVHPNGLVQRENLQESMAFPGFPGQFFLKPIHSGWWFGTWLLWLSIQLGMSSSQVTFTPSFFRGWRKTTNQH